MSVLFEPVTIGGLRLKNRFVRSATNDYLGRPDGSISAQQIDLYRDLAAGGVSLIVTGHAYVQHPLGRASVNQNAIYDDRFIEGYRRLADAMHAEGAALVVQISHAGRQTPQDWPADQVPVAPSAVWEGQTGRTPRALTEEEIWSRFPGLSSASRIWSPDCVRGSRRRSAHPATRASIPRDCGVAVRTSRSPV